MPSSQFKSKCRISRTSVESTAESFRCPSDERVTGAGKFGKVSGSQIWYIWYYKGGARVRQLGESAVKRKTVARLDQQRSAVAAGFATADKTLSR